jgi:hypothetical protein
MSLRPVIVTENSRLSLLPDGEPLEISNGINESDAVTLRQLNSAVLAGGGGGESTSTVSWNQILNKPSTFIPSTHSHAISDITGLQTTLNNLSAGTNVDLSNYYTKNEVDNLITMSSDLGYFSLRYGAIASHLVNGYVAIYYFTSLARRCTLRIEATVTHLKAHTSTAYPSVLYPNSVPKEKTEINVVVLNQTISHPSKLSGSSSSTYGSMEVTDSGVSTAADTYILPALMAFYPHIRMSGSSGGTSTDTVYDYWVDVRLEAKDYDTGAVLTDAVQHLTFQGYS